jgi:hypothetical protein
LKTDGLHFRVFTCREISAANPGHIPHTTAKRNGVHSCTDVAAVHV